VPIKQPAVTRPMSLGEEAGWLAEGGGGGVSVGELGGEVVMVRRVVGLR